MAIDKHDLFELYKMATETDRYELELGWKLVQFFTVLNSGLMGLGFTLLGSDQLSSKLYVIPIFVVGTLVSSIDVDVFYCSCSRHAYFNLNLDILTYR